MNQVVPIQENQHYGITRNGKVWSYRKNIWIHSHKNNSGYFMVWFKEKGKTYGRTIHRLVAKTFIPNPENKAQVNHIDGKKENNNIDNLEWCTVGENHKHAWATGLKTSTIAHKKGARKNGKKTRLLTLEEANEIRDIYKKVMTTQRKLAKLYGVSFQTISKIIKKEIYND